MAAPPPRQSAGPAPTRGDAHPAHAREDLNTFPPVLVVRTTEAGTRPSPCRPLHAGRAVDERRLPCRQGHECSTGPAQKAGRTGRQEARGRREREEGGERNDFATFCWRHGAVNRPSPMYATPRPVCEGAPPLPVEGRSSPCSLRTCRVSRGARGAAKAGRSPWRLRQRSLERCPWRACLARSFMVARRGGECRTNPQKILPCSQDTTLGQMHWKSEPRAERLGSILRGLARTRALKHPRNP